MGKEALDKPLPTTVFDYSPDSWAKIADDIARIDLHAFTDPSNDTHEHVRDGFSRPNFDNPEFLTVLLQNEAGSVIGYSQAEQFWTHVSARIVRTALAPEYKGRGLVGSLMDRMEAELKARGVTVVMRKVRINNGYAEAIRRHYGERIVKDYTDGIRTAEERCFLIKI